MFQTRMVDEGRGAQGNLHSNLGGRRQLVTAPESTPKGGSRLRLNRPDEAGIAYSRTCRNRMRLSWRGNGTVARKGRRRPGAGMAVRSQVLGAFVYVDDGAGEVARTGHRLETPGHMHAGFQSARMSFRTVDTDRHDRGPTWMRICFHHSRKHSSRTAARGGATGFTADAQGTADGPTHALPRTLP